MEMILIVIVIPELVALAIGLCMVFASLNGCGDFKRIIPKLSSRRTKVASQYWGSYGSVASPKVAMPMVPLPKIHKYREIELEGVDWNG